MFMVIVSVFSITIDLFINFEHMYVRLTTKQFFFQIHISHKINMFC